MKKSITKQKKERLFELAKQNLGASGREGHQHKNSNLKDMFLDIGVRGGTLFALVNRSGWCQYSRGCGWYVERNVLVGCDSESGDFAIRVPAKLKNINEAITWMIPAEAKKAKKQKRAIIRQGDVYFFQQTRGMGNMGNLPHPHTAEKTEDGWTIHHPEHTITELAGFAWKACPQRRLADGGTD